jgi:hypothetical protein|tara:strand:+ start:352 stop:510 length:159 start_codon:yes stop_codon:yes gene_type:complete
MNDFQMYEEGRKEAESKQCDIHVVKCSVCGWSKEKDKECEYCVMQYARNWGL